ncbi:MAG: ABC transporter permease [Bacillota bacterium]
MRYQYVARRLWQGFLVLLGISVIVFLMIHMVPGDPVRQMLGERATPEAVAALRHELGLDLPMHMQLGRFFVHLARGDLGRSLLTGVPVAQELLQRYRVTMQLAIYALIIEALLGVTVGILAAVRRGTAADYLATSMAVLGMSLPSFWLALALMWLFGYVLGWFPISGYQGVYHLVLPSFTLGILSAAYIARVTRSSLLEVLGQDYIRTARSKGLSERAVLYRHALKNALIPVVTMVGLDLGYLLGGAIVTETVFALPGVGSYVVKGILTRDFPVVQGGVLVVAATFVLVNLMVDLVYGALDPRVKAS